MDSKRDEGILKLPGILRNESERPTLYRAAVRYRLGGDALRFVCETHEELPPQPPPGLRTLVLFAHFDPQGIVDPYVVYYLKALHGLGATILFVSGSPTLTAESVAPIRSLCACIYTRRTLSLDFGSWHLAWCILTQRGWSLDQFDRFVITNDSVFGPLFPIEEMWSSFRDAEMYGAIESAEQIPHLLQSFFLAWDLNADPPLPQRLLGWVSVHCRQVRPYPAIRDRLIRSALKSRDSASNCSFRRHHQSDLRQFTGTSAGRAGSRDCPSTTPCTSGTALSSTS